LTSDFPSSFRPDDRDAALPLDRERSTLEDSAGGDGVSSGVKRRGLEDFTERDMSSFRPGTFSASDFDVGCDPVDLNAACGFGAGVAASRISSGIAEKESS
jgi:hypothetical protein